MELLRRGDRLATLALVALALLGAASPLAAQAPPREQPRFGGVLKVAITAEPPSLDPHRTTTIMTHQIMWHVFETLYSWDKDQRSPIPHLAAGHTVTDGGRQYTITLRKGIRFHNGKELTAADVVASLNRWGRRAGLGGKELWKSVEVVDAKGPYEIVIHLKEPSWLLISALAFYTAVIYPKEIIDATGDGPLKQFIGTGPFRFVEHKPDRHIRLARFKEYPARSEPPNGAGGKRVAYLDELLFIPVPDVAVRLAGVESGSYHYSASIKQDQYDRVLTMRSVEPRIGSPSLWIGAVLNHKQGLMTSKKLRQAFQAALDMQPIMAAEAGHPLFYRLDPSLFPRELVLWYSTAGGAFYNQGDKEKARRLLKEAGYVGQPVRWLTRPESVTALVAKQQLEEVGFKIDLQVLDSATVARYSNKPELFDVVSRGWVFGNTDPVHNSILQCTYPGWWCHEEKERLFSELARETDPRKRKAIIDRIQVLFYEDVGRIKFGDLFTLSVVRRELRGDFRSSQFFTFSNAWLEKK